jgi:hypothetical protein
MKGYIGTYHYSLDEMQECLHKPNYVDLYYNDVCCFIKTLDKYASDKKLETNFKIEEE